MKTLYLDKKERVRGWMVSPAGWVAGGLAVLVLFAPIWPETRTGRFSLEPVQKASIHAIVAGEITGVMPQEGDRVGAGTLLVRMRNLDLESKAAHTAAELQLASLRATEARLHYTDYARAEREREAWEQQAKELASQLAELRAASPINGVVLTPRVRDLVGSYVQAGDPLLEVADVTLLRARIYIPEFDMRGVQVGSPVSLKLDSGFGRRESQVAAVAPAASAMEPGLAPPDTYLGMSGVEFYAVTALVPNPDGGLKPTMAGSAKVLIGRRSLVGLAGKTVRDFVQRTVW